MRRANRFLFPLVAILVPLLFVSCRALVRDSFRTPKVRFVDFAIPSNPLANPNGPWEGTLTLSVENPNAYPLNVAYVAYSAIIGKETLAEGEHREAVRIAPSGVTQVEIPVRIPRKDAFAAAARQVFEARKIAWEFNGSVGLDAPIAGVVRIPFSKTGVVDPVDILRHKGIGFN